MVAAKTPTIQSLEEKIERLTLTVHRLTQVVSTRLEAPAVQLRVRPAAERAGCGVSTLEKVAAKGVFTDDRKGKGKGSARLFYADELDVFRSEGEGGVLRFREQLGRD